MNSSSTTPWAKPDAFVVLIGSPTKKRATLLVTLFSLAKKQAFAPFLSSREKARLGQIFKSAVLVRAF
jgi:hypothetical protein